MRGFPSVYNIAYVRRDCKRFYYRFSPTQKKLPELLINREDAMAVDDIYELKGHRGSALYGVEITTGRAEAAAIYITSHIKEDNLLKKFLRVRGTLIP